MIFYINLFIFIFIFGFVGTFGKNKEFAFVCRRTVMLILFIVSAVRFGIGTDYQNYEILYKAISNGKEFYKFSEPAFYWLNNFLASNDLSFQVLIVICSAITVFFFDLSTNRKTFFYEVLLFYSLIYLQSYCLLRQMIACSISIYALKNPKRSITFIFLIVAALFHKTFWCLFLLVYLSKFIKLSKIKIELLLLVLFFVIFCTNIVEITLQRLTSLFSISIGVGYFELQRRIGLVVFTRYIFMLLFWISLYGIIKKTDRKMRLFNTLLIALFLVEFIGGRLLIFAARFPQTFYVFFFIPFTKNNSVEINTLVKNKYKIRSSFFIESVCLIILVLFVQVGTGENLNHIVPYKSIFSF